MDFERRRIALTSAEGSPLMPPLLVAAFATRVAHAIEDSSAGLEPSGEPSLMRISERNDFDMLGLLGRRIFCPNALRGTSESSAELYPGEAPNDGMRT